MKVNGQDFEEVNSFYQQNEALINEYQFAVNRMQTLQHNINDLERQRDEAISNASAQTVPDTTRYDEDIALKKNELAFLSSNLNYELSNARLFPAALAIANKNQEAFQLDYQDVVISGGFQVSVKSEIKKSLFEIFKEGFSSMIDSLVKTFKNKEDKSPEMLPAADTATSNFYRLRRVEGPNLETTENSQNTNTEQHNISPTRPTRN